MTTFAIYDLSQFGLIQFSGEEAQSFLQGQLSCDVNSLAPEKSTFGSYCSPKGRILATFLLWHSEQGYVMQLPAVLREPIQKRLSMFILRSRVTATDVSNESVKLGVAGKDAAALLERSFGRAPQAVHDVVRSNGVTVVRLPLDRLEIIVPKHKAPHIMELLADGAEMAPSGYWDWLDIRAGIPVITPAVQEEFVPQMVNLDLTGGVSFTKGCYPGQEIVARMHYRGQVKQRMYLAHMAGESMPNPGDKLYSEDLGEQSCGMIVNAARAPEGGYDALAVIQIAAVDAGGVHWLTLDGPTLKLLPLPYRVE